MLTLSRHREEWQRSIERDCSLLHCSNPRCVHLFKHTSKGENGVDFTDLKCETTVLVDVLGNREKRYRFQPGDHIHVACQGRLCSSTQQRHTTMCHLVCGECMNADPHPAHLGMAGECRACIAETKNRALTKISEGIRGGPRSAFAEEANENSYRDAQKFALADEEEDEVKRARKGADGGEARRREALARIKAKRSQAKAAERSAHDKLAEATERLKAYEAGYTFVGEKEYNDKVDLKGENHKLALEFWQTECAYEDVAKMRERFPQCALMWMGPPPSEEQLLEQRTKVQVLTEAHQTTEEAMAIVVRETEEADVVPEEGQAAVEYDAPEEAAAAGAAAGVGAGAGEAAAEGEAEPAGAAPPVGNPNPRRGGRKAKRVGEMNEQELANHRVARARQQANRRENEAKKKQIIDAYPDLVARVQNCDKQERELQRKNQVVEAQTNLLAQKDRLIVEAQDRVNEEMDLFVGWLSSTRDKPDDWDGDEMTERFNAYRSKKLKRKREREQAAEQS